MSTDADVAPGMDAASTPPEVDAAIPDDAPGDMPPANQGSPDRPLNPTDARPPPDVRLDNAAPESVPDRPPGPVVCGSDPGCVCGGTLCSCGLNQSCTFPGVGCEPATGSCSLLCHNRNRCTGACQNFCTIECYGGSTCILTTGANADIKVEGVGAIGTFTVGPNSQVECENSANCAITCTGSCTLECKELARCALTCGSAPAIQADLGGSCP